MPRGEPIPTEELQQIMDLFVDCRKRGMSKMDCYTRIGQLVGRTPKVIGVTITRLNPTTDLAKMFIRARAMKLVKRLVNKAGPSEIINILERPSMGVLDAPSKVGEGQGGFFISVSADTCGAVKVGVAQGIERPQLEAAADFDPFADYQQDANVIDTIAVKENAHVEDGNAKNGPTRAELVIAQVRKRLEDARNSA